MYNVSLENPFYYLTLINQVIVVMETLGGDREVEGKMAPPMPYILNCDMILGSYI